MGIGCFVMPKNLIINISNLVMKIIYLCICFLLGVWEYIQKMRNILYDLERRIQKCKDNVEMMRLMMLVSICKEYDFWLQGLEFVFIFGPVWGSSFLYVFNTWQNQVQQIKIENC